MTPGGFEHGGVAITIYTPVDVFVRANDLGTCVAAVTGFMLSRNPDTVRAADFAFVSKRRLRHIKDLGAYFPGAPDLTVEVVSPWDRLADVLDMVKEWLAAEAKLVWLIEPRHRTVTVYRRGKKPQTLTEADTLVGGEVLPGFSLPAK